MFNKSMIPVFLLTFSICLPLSYPLDAAEQPDTGVIIGEWIRPDGRYVIRVRHIDPDGSVDAGYYNPSEINVAGAEVSVWKGFVKLFLELQDEGYPGSTYTLYYYEEEDALAGFYYQAVVDKTYEVVFLRKQK